MGGGLQHHMLHQGAGHEPMFVLLAIQLAASTPTTTMARVMRMPVALLLFMMLLSRSHGICGELYSSINLAPTLEGVQDDTAV